MEEFEGGGGGGDGAEMRMIRWVGGWGWVVGGGLFMLAMTFGVMCMFRLDG